MIRVFTSAAPNYLGKVRTLVASLKKHHPELELHLVVAELPAAAAIDAEAEGLASVMSLADLGSAGDPGWLFAHSIVELCTAVKGAALELLLARDDTEAVIYLDPDIVLFSRLDDLLAELRDSSIALTPHLLRPEAELDAIRDNEICALRHGAFNLGFVGVRNTEQGRSFVAWWRERLDKFCWAEPESGLFTDQKWMDLVPGFFSDLRLLRDTRFNVAPWNISQRQVRGNFDRGFTVDGKPLGFYHFTGFDSGAHDAMLDKYAPDNRALRMLAEWYRRRSQSLSAATGEWRLGCFSDGASIAPIHRHLYRQRPDVQRAFPDPFAAAGDGTYRAWFESHAAQEYPELHDRIARACPLEREPPPALAEELAAHAAHAAHAAEAEEARHRDAVESALAGLRLELESSTSWRLSSPLRLAGEVLKRLGVQRPR
jgi:hypothetical protein